MFFRKIQDGKTVFFQIFVGWIEVPFEKVNARGKKKGSALSLTKKEDALSLTRERVS